MEPVPGRPAAGAGTRQRPYADQYVRGFVAAHRKRIFVGLSLAGTLLLGPFAVNNFFQDRILVGVVTVIFVACLLVNARALWRDRVPPVPPGGMFLASVVGLGWQMYTQGLTGVLWVYPGILLFHFVLRRRRANMFNAALVLLALPFAWMHLGPAVTARVAVTLVLLIIFANIYSYIADVQQEKEAEQRQRLDALVEQLEAQNTALREAFRLREEVERIARHDLKTPLASIASVPRLLREHRPLDARESELLGMVERAALRMLSMVNLSLDLYRMEEGTYRLRAQAVDLGAIVRTVARELRAHAESKRVALRLELPPAPLHAQGEELLCYSTVANLLKNALEASPEGAQVQVVLRRAGADALELSIHNQGEVPAAVRDSFFRKYATHGKSGGTGLGAYSARLMARVQRGELDMSCAAGATQLRLRLPAWQGEAPLQESTPSHPVPLDTRPLPALSVLLVDDDEYNIVVLKSLLPSPPLAVRTAVNGLAALQCVREARPDLIFLDVEMPVMGGIEAALAIRALQRERGEAPSTITAFSAHEDDATRQRCLAAGFDLYMAKPASREEVYAVLRGEDPAQAPRAPAAPVADGTVAVDPALLPLMPEFLASRRALARELLAALERGERDTVRAMAHKLAGSLAMYGFAQASRVCLEVEQGAEGEPAQLRARCEALQELLARVEPVARAS